jgi:hypothetical protein
MWAGEFVTEEAMATGRAVMPSRRVDVTHFTANTPLGVMILACLQVNTRQREQDLSQAVVSWERFAAACGRMGRSFSPSVYGRMPATIATIAASLKQFHVQKQTNCIVRRGNFT